MEEIFENAEVISILDLARGISKYLWKLCPGRRPPLPRCLVYINLVMPFAPSDFSEDDQSCAEGCRLFSRSYMDDIAIYSQSYHKDRVFLKEIFV